MGEDWRGRGYVGLEEKFPLQAERLASVVAEGEENYVPQTRKAKGRK